MIPTSLIGIASQGPTATIERGRLRLFAKAIGETDPVYTDVAAARAAGHPDLPVPPTFLFGVELEAPDPFAWLTDLGVDLRRVLHGEQSFSYHAMAYAGDVLSVRSTISDIYTRKGGSMEFVVRTGEITRDGEPVATLETVTIIRRQEGDRE